MTFQKSFLHFFSGQFSEEVYPVLQLSFPDQSAQVTAICRYFQLFLRCPVCRQIISCHIHLYPGIFLPDLWQGLQQIVQSFQRIIRLTDENGIGFTVLRLPLSFIKGSPQGLIHRIIMCLGIPRGSHCPVPGGSSGDIAGKSYCFPLHYTSAGKFFLLAAQGILLHQIPESGLVDLRFRHIGKICLRTQRTDSLNSHQYLLLVGKHPAYCQCVWIFRAEAVDHIRCKVFRDPMQFFFQ